jgi:hypothetical protein
MADQESRGVNRDDSGADEEDSVMRENLAEGGGAVNAEVRLVSLVYLVCLVCLVE